MDDKDKLIAELKAENEKLREDYIKLSQQKDLDNARWQKRCTDLHVEDKAKADKYWLVLQEIKAIAEPFAKCYTHTCRNCEKYDSAHACCLKDINCYKYNDGSKSSCKDFVLPAKQFYQQILANVITQITKAESEG